MIIYRPHRGGLAESMAEAREFESVEAMKEYIVQQHTDEELGPAFDMDDVIVQNPLFTFIDHRIGWNDGLEVSVKRYYDEDFIEKYMHPLIVGYCATDYGSLEQSQRMCEEFLEVGR